MRHRLVVLDHELAADSPLNELPVLLQEGCSPCGISFERAPYRATLPTSIRFEPSTKSAPNQSRRLADHQRSLLGTDSSHVVLVSPKELRPGREKTQRELSQPETMRAGSQ